jgi:hypothetical protein
MADDVWTRDDVTKLLSALTNIQKVLERIAAATEGRSGGLASGAPVSQVPEAARRDRERGEKRAGSRAPRTQRELG